MHGARGSIFLVAIVFALLILQSVFARVLAPHPFAPYLGLPIVFALGTAHGVRVLRGAITAFAIGYLSTRSPGIRSAFTRSCSYSAISPPGSSAF